MPGMLTLGAMKGASDEFLKQSGEERQNKYQHIRDKRLSELKKTEATHSSGLLAGREEAARAHGDKNYSFGYGENVVRGGEVVQTGGDRPTSSSTAKTGNLITLTTGDQIPYDQLRKSYADIAFTKDEFGNPIRNPDVPNWDQWWNTQVSDQHQRDLPKEAPPPEPEAEEDGPGFFDKLGSWITGGDEEAPKEGRGGMLSEEAPTKAPIKLQRPLTRSAKDDPVQMYDELMAQLMGTDGVSEQDVIDTIRQHFRDPQWNPPANALK